MRSVHRHWHVSVKRKHAFLISRAHSLVWWVPFVGAIVCVGVAVFEMLRMDDRSMRVIGVPAALGFGGGVCWLSFKFAKALWNPNGLNRRWPGFGMYAVWLIIGCSVAVFLWHIPRKADWPWWVFVLLIPFIIKPLVNRIYRTFRFVGLCSELHYRTRFVRDSIQPSRGEFTRSDETPTEPNSQKS